MLLQKGALVDATDYTQWTSLQHAAYYGHEKIARVLLQHGASVHANADFKWSALHIACFKQREGLVKLLLSYGAKVHKRTSQLYVPLRIATFDLLEEAIAAQPQGEGLPLGAGQFKGKSAIEIARLLDNKAIVSELQLRCTGHRLGRLEGAGRWCCWGRL